MTAPSAPLPTFHLHFEGEGTLGHTVPASALAQAVQAFQRAVHLLAMAYEGKELGQRARVNMELDRKYSVMFQLPAEGGYDLPYQIGNAALTLFDPDDIAKVTEQHVDVLSAVQAGDIAKLRRVIPSAPYRKLIATELRRMQPHPRLGLVVSIEDFRRAKLFDGWTAHDRIAPLLSEQPAPSILPKLVTGRLDALDFQARKLTLQLPNGRTVEAVYDDALLPVLLENPGQFIQVRGEAMLNEDGSLKRLNSVEEIHEVDDSPLSIEAISVDGASYPAREPPEFKVTFDPEEGYVAEGPFHVIETGETRRDLEALVQETLTFLWREYVVTDAAGLSEDARDLRRDLMARFGTTPDAV